MPTERITLLLDELETMGFCGYITFHHLSEAFLDKRLMAVARDAKRRRMKPYIHTNGDVLRNDEALCHEASEIFEYIVVGLYDYETEDEKRREKEFWLRRLSGTTVMFSLAEKVYVRTHSPNSSLMSAVRRTHPDAVCAEPRKYLLIHYNGDVACCCEDMHGELLKMNIFETSIREVWYSPRHAQLIEALKVGNRKQFALCTKCTMGPSRYSADPMQATQHYDR